MISMAFAKTLKAWLLMGEEAARGGLIICRELRAHATNTRVRFLKKRGTLPGISVHRHGPDGMSNLCADADF